MTQEIGLVHRKVDFLLRHLNVQFQDVRPPPNDIEQLIIASDRIGAMRLYQQRFNVGMADAKRAIEEMAAKLGLP